MSVVSAPPPLIEILRDAAVESRHRGAIVAVTPRNELLAALGHGDEPCFLRSAAKPFQAVVVVAAGAAERHRLTDRELALIAASHNGEPMHVECVSALLDRLRLAPDLLQCGVHPPFNSAAARLMAGQSPTVLHNNCSGKHAGMLAACLAAGFPVAGYEHVDHPLQRRIRDVIAEFSDVATDAMPFGLDGCTVPTWAIPLRAIALAYARLVNPVGVTHYAVAARRVAAAMMTHPEMVGGTERIDTDLMRAAPGDIVSKVGAEGVHAVAVPPGRHPRYPDGLGVALKIEDGDAFRARNPAIIAALEQLGVLSQDAAARLMEKYSRPIVTNRKQPAGEARVAFRLAETAQNG